MPIDSGGGVVSAAPAKIAANTSALGSDPQPEALQREIDAAVRLVWDYHHVGHAVSDDPAFLLSLDGILVFCSSDVSVADFASDLWIRTADLHDAAREKITLFKITWSAAARDALNAGDAAVN